MSESIPGGSAGEAGIAGARGPKLVPSAAAQKHPMGPSTPHAPPAAASLLPPTPARATDAPAPHTPSPAVASSTAPPHGTRPSGQAPLGSSTAAPPPPVEPERRRQSKRLRSSPEPAAVEAAAEPVAETATRAETGAEAGAEVSGRPRRAGRRRAVRLEDEAWAGVEAPGAGGGPGTEEEAGGASEALRPRRARAKRSRKGDGAQAAEDGSAAAVAGGSGGGGAVRGGLDAVQGPAVLRCVADLEAAVAHLRAADPRLVPLIDAHGLPLPLIATRAPAAADADGPAAAVDPSTALAGIGAPSATAAAAAAATVPDDPGWDAGANGAGGGDAGGGDGGGSGPGGGVFSSLCRSLVYQQLATKAAAAIWGRVLAACQVPSAAHLTPAHVLSADPAALRAAGLSGRKAEYLTGVAQAFGDRAGWDEQLAATTDPAALAAALTPLRGVGHWTVHMLAMFQLGLADVMPSGDLGVRRGLQILHGLSSPPDPAQVEQITESWRPYRSVGAWYMWRIPPPPRTRAAGAGGKKGGAGGEGVGRKKSRKEETQSSEGAEGAEGESDGAEVKVEVEVRKEGGGVEGEGRRRVSRRGRAGSGEEVTEQGEGDGQAGEGIPARGRRRGRS